MSVVLETSQGDLTIDLYYEERPMACKNFLLLCEMKYFNFCLFHSIQINFTAQTGDPTGTGRGGESIYRELFGDQAKYFEAERRPNIKHRKRGTVSMVNNGNDEHGSQFFITLSANLDSLDGIHTVFGEVVDGWDVLDKINNAVVDRDFRPYQDIRILHTVVLENPFEIPNDLEFPERSPSPTLERIQSSTIAIDELFEDEQLRGKTDQEIKDFLAEKEAKTKAQILELIGDLPEADIKPPENVLFVCKLNPVTNDEDLETIFSRFGEIISCEIVRDKKTGDSLCYAFIEYENKEDAEQAFFKMDNVLIDDRRIHVDFSQSVAKAKWEYDKKQRKLNLMKAKLANTQKTNTNSSPRRESSSKTSSRHRHNDHQYRNDRRHDDRQRDDRKRDDRRREDNYHEDRHRDDRHRDDSRRDYYHREDRRHEGRRHEDRRHDDKSRSSSKSDRDRKDRNRRNRSRS